MRVIITVINDIATDQRVLRQTALLNELHCETLIIGRHLRGSPELPPVASGSLRLKLFLSRGPLMYIAFNLRLFLTLLFRKADFYVSNDLDTLLPCFIISKLFRRKLVYDAHEYFTGQHSLVERSLKHWLWKKLEKRLLPKIKHMLTVSEGIADIYKAEYGVDPVVVRNLSPSSKAIIARSRNELDIDNNQLLVILQGTGINPGRGGDQLIKAVADIEGVKLIILGEGDEMESIRENAAKKGLDGKVIFLPRMSWDSMMSYTKCCDAGLSLDLDTCINQRYSLPNKLFDYISAGIPVIASPLPEVKAIIDKYNCGIILKEVTPDDIAEALKKLRDDVALLKFLKQNASSASGDLAWEKEKIKEQALFMSVITDIQKKQSE